MRFCNRASIGIDVEGVISTSPCIGEIGPVVESDSATGLEGISNGTPASKAFAWHPVITKKADKKSKLTAIRKRTS
jgi:hypothetical protein